METRTSDSLSYRQLRHQRGASDRGDRSVLRLAGSGAGLQDRRAQDQGSASQGAGHAWRALRYPPLSQCAHRRWSAAAFGARAAHRRLDRAQSPVMVERCDHDMTFAKQTVLITGAAGNLGRAVADAFFERGANLALIGRRLEELTKAYGR